MSCILVGRLLAVNCIYILFMFIYNIYISSVFQLYHHGNVFLIHMQFSKKMNTNANTPMFFLWNNIFRYYHDNRNFTRLLTMLSNEVVARARRLVGEHVLENLLAVSKKAVLWTCFYRVTTPCEQSLLLSSWGRTRKGGSAWIASSLWSHRSPKFWTSQSRSLSSN